MWVYNRYNKDVRVSKKELSLEYEYVRWNIIFQLPKFIFTFLLQRTHYNDISNLSNPTCTHIHMYAIVMKYSYVNLAILLCKIVNKIFRKIHHKKVIIFM